MPLSKTRNRERMKEAMRVKRMLQPDKQMLQPSFYDQQWIVKPNRYLTAHLNVYPTYLDELKARTYKPELDSYINPMMR